MRLVNKFIVVLCFYLLLVIAAGLNFTGFCISQARWLTDEEKINAAINYHNNRDRIPIKTPDRGTQYYPQVKYENVEHFKKENPDCCIVRPGVPVAAPPSSILNRLLGSDANEPIVIKFNARYLDQDGKIKTQKKKYTYILTNCGEVRED